MRTRHPGFVTDIPRSCGQGLAVAFAHRCLLRLSCLFFTGVAEAEESIAARLSPEWKSLHSEVAALDAALDRLPDIPVENYGGTRAFLQVFAESLNPADRSIDFTIRLRWPEAQPVDLVALVPAREIDSLGLDPNYGFPEDFTVSLLEPDGGSRAVASFEAMSTRPAHRGHPIVARDAGGQPAAGIELHITKARAPRPGAPVLVFVALAEVFCFSGDHNLAANASVEIVSEGTAQLPSFWSPGLLIDGVTPLGLPERPATTEPERKDIGWLSRGRSEADERMTVTLDLGRPRRLDGLRLFPALRPSIGDFPGFGIPEHFRLRISNHPAEPDARIVLDHTDLPTPDIGHNPHEFHFPPVEARYIGLEATRLWKPYPLYPAFFGLSEMQVLKGDEVVSEGARVIVSEEAEPVLAQADRWWSPAALTDGRGPTGPLISRRHWLEDLDKRLQLETRRHHALDRMAHLDGAWDRGALATSAVVGLAALGLAALLPFRYRSRERRRIRDIRQRIAGDLHDDVGSNLGSIQMLTEMARHKPDSRDELETIHRVAAETVNSVRDIVWLLHPLETQRVPTIDHLRESAAILLDPLDWTLCSDFRDWQLGDEDGRHLVLFFREVLHNIRRHADASRIAIHVHSEEEQFVLSIEDDGRGIPAEKLNRPTSLRALRQRAGRLGGTVEIDSDPSRGTTVVLRFKPRASGSAETPLPHPDPS